MCKFCVQVLFQSMNLDSIKSLRAGDPCPTRGCGGCLIQGYSCRAYPAERVLLNKPTYPYSSSQDSTRDCAISDPAQCFKLYRMKRKIGLSSPCDQCICDENYRGLYEFLYCPICGFFITYEKEIGYTEHHVIQPIIIEHHTEILNETLDAACGVIISPQGSVSDLSNNQKDILRLEGYISISDFTEHGLHILRERISLQSKSQHWIEKALKDKVQFIWHNDSWRESPLLSPRKLARNRSVFIDVNVLRSALGPNVFERVCGLVADEGLSVEEFFEQKSELKLHYLILFLILKDMVLCKVNEMALSEILAELALANYKSKDREYLLTLWNEVMDHVERYRFDLGTLQAATVLSRVYTEIMEGKEADPKDAYHFVFCVQHGVGILATNDKFLKSMPTFLERTSKEGLDSVVSRCLDIYKMLYPSFIKIYTYTDLYGGFRKIMESHVKILSNESSSEELKKVLIESKGGCGT